MILMEEGGGYGAWSGGEIIDIDEGDGGAGDDLTLDLDMIYSVLEKPDVPSLSSQDDIPNENPTFESATDIGNQTNFEHQNGFQTFPGAHALDSEFDDTAVFFQSDATYGGSASNNVKLDTLSRISYPVHTNSGSFKEWIPSVTRDQEEKMDGLLQSEIPNSSCSTASSFTEGESNNISNITGNLDFNNFLGDGGIQLTHAAANNDSIDVSHGLYMDSLNGKFGHGGTLPENSFRSSGRENDLLRSMDVYFQDIDVSLHNVATTQSTSFHYPDVNNELGAHPSAVQFGSNSDTAYFIDAPPCYLSGDFSFGLSHSNEVRDFQSESACSACENPMIDYCDDKVLNFRSKGISPSSGNFSSNADDRFVGDKLVGVSSSYIQSAVSKKQLAIEEDETAADWVACRSMMCHSDEITKQVLSREVSSVDESSHFVEESKPSPSGVLSSVSAQKNVVYITEEKGDSDVAFIKSRVNGISGKFTLTGSYLNSVASDHYLLSSKESNANKQMSCINQGRDGKLNQPKQLGHLSSASPESIQSSLTGSKSHFDDDLDICIIEDSSSQPACSYQSLAFGKANASLQHSPYGNSIQYIGVGSTKPKVNDESVIFRAALQDLSQPNSEASPPEGVLAVPLLRHQRIALSWMVQKETSSMYCSGGILADDQGLGKTVSTIALILKERPPSIKADVLVVKKEEFETLDLDEDVNEVSPIKEDANSSLIMSNCGLSKNKNIFGQSKGRPAAGTLVVCPTSVLRQWAEELQKKVTSKANLSVLVYHGSNRTKDPCELAKYDVVITTYSIVSMEVPKQPLTDEDDGEKGKVEGDDVASLGLSSGKKRKYPPSSGKKGPRNKKGMDATLLESVARPLAKVAWFRVVLDEAQSIKNHRTQVARACWGLRAKRRWCLSGTPIQNAIDDLYSYFKFLRYDPYDVYNSFCSAIKIPIQKSPTKGYKKLQAVLKTIMLRRTKGTQIDGKPIINLPPKVIELKKVDFTDEERDFYTQLENDSREQFREYAAAGTVKQNYVNILWMLLRLRQACDHPLLVRDINSNSLGRSSMEMAKTLPQEKQMCLLNWLETSLAICGICNDPPEDAVVSICGHVFCKQCICEHLTGDDNLCPTSKCKVRLNKSSVFTKATLKGSLSDQPPQDAAGCDLGGEANPYSEGLPYDSSKIRAAIEVLQSLKKPQDCRSRNGSLEKSFDGIVTCHENLHNAQISVDGNNTDKEHMQEGENISGSVQVVGEKAIVFSQWTRMLDLLEACLKSSSVQYRRLDGTMSVVARDKAVKDFNTLPEVTVMIMSLKAASLGLNMVAACRVLLLDLWWNPTTEDQAIDRAHRIGQTRPVTVLRLTVKDTVEDRILALQQKKREMVASAFGEDETGGQQTRLTVDDLKYLFMV